ncbi:MAG: myxococcus cysteine-rich repeat containing protein [Gammaproteobacteria bacterium]|nr:myxococcus cysteine-rich repeat containing protein [Gammaproteobacteria bacterium]
MRPRTESVLLATLVMAPVVVARAGDHLSVELQQIPTKPGVSRLFCGDGVPDPGEECDDGNMVSGDGCSAFCTVEIIDPCFGTPGNTVENILVDGSFEDYNAGGEWTSIFHSIFGSVICDHSCFGAPLAGAGDNFVLIAGGSFNENSTGNVTHAPMAIPADATTLEFQWMLAATDDECAGPADGMALSIAGTQVWSSTDAGACTVMTPYQRVVIDLTGAAGGPYQGTVAGFEFTASATGIPSSMALTNIFLDDVSINIPVEPPLPDCEPDGVPDKIDNCLIHPNTDQRDTDGDGHGNVCDGDLNQDCIINLSDLAIFRSVFFTADADADLDGDGIVNFADLGIMKNQFLGPPGPSGIASCP